MKFRSSSQWAHVAEQLKSSSRYDAYSTALTLLPQLAWLGSPVQDHYFYVRQVGNVVRPAAVAAIDNGNPIAAVEWLEQGRSITLWDPWGLFFIS